MKKRVGKKMNGLITENKNLKSKIVKNIQKEIVEETKEIVEDSLEDIKKIGDSQGRLDKLYRKDIKDRKFELNRISERLFKTMMLFNNGSERQDRIERQIRDIVIALTMQTFMICWIAWKLIL